MTTLDREAETATKKESSRRWSDFRGVPGARWYGFFVLIAFIALFGVLKTDTFLTVDNFRAIAGNQAVAAILAIALVVPLVTGQFDLSVASVLTLSMIVCTGLFSSFHAPVWLAVTAGITVGLLIGLVNGVCVARIGINSLIVTLATGSGAVGAAQWWTNGTIFSQDIPASFQGLGQDNLAGIPQPVIYMLIIAALAWWLLERTPVGRYLYALGDNPDAARLTGLRTSRLTVGAFVTSGGLAGLAGVVEAAKLGAGNPTVGAGFLLPAFAAAFLGATIFRLGQYNVLGTLVAVFVVAVGIAGLEQLGVPFYIEPIFTGIVLLGAVALTKLEGRRPAGAASVVADKEEEA